MSGSYRPGSTYKSLFTTSNPTTGAASDADSLPSAAGFRNGALDSGWTLTVADIGVGRYSISGTVPSGYAQYDRVDVVVSATVGGVAAAAVVDRFEVDAGIAVVETGTAQAGSSTTITLDLDSTLTASIVGTGIISLDSGAGAGQWRRITAVNVSVPTAIVVTVATAWYANPNTTTTYSITSEDTVQANLQTIKDNTINCPSAVTVGAFVGNAIAALGVDASGRVDVGKILGTASAGVAGYVGLDWSHINAPTTTIAFTGTTIGTVATVGDKTGYSLSSAGIDAIVVETGINARQSLSAILASAAGVISGAVAAGDTGTTLVKNPAGSATRASVVLDGDGNRTAVTLSLPA